MKPFAAAMPKLAAEVARHLALWMGYEDIIRVADLKTRASRFERVRKEVGAKDGEPVVVIDYLKPGVEEFASVLPHSLGKTTALVGRAPRQARRLQRRHAHQDFERLRLPAGAQPRLAASPWRPMSYRYREEQALIERWLGLRARRGARATCALALRDRRMRAPHQGLRRDAPPRQGATSSPSSTRWWTTRPPPMRASRRRRSARRARRRSPIPRARRSARRLGKPVVWLKPVT